MFATKLDITPSTTQVHSRPLKMARSMRKAIRKQAKEFATRRASGEAVGYGKEISKRRKDIHEDTMKAMKTLKFNYTPIDQEDIRHIKEYGPFRLGKVHKSFLSNDRIINNYLSKLSLLKPKYENGLLDMMEDEFSSHYSTLNLNQKRNFANYLKERNSLLRTVGKRLAKHITWLQEAILFRQGLVLSPSIKALDERERQLLNDIIHNKTLVKACYWYLISSGMGWWFNSKIAINIPNSNLDGDITNDGLYDLVDIQDNVYEGEPIFGGTSKQNSYVGTINVIIGGITDTYTDDPNMLSSLTLVNPLLPNPLAGRPAPSSVVLFNTLDPYLALKEIDKWEPINDLLSENDFEYGDCMLHWLVKEYPSIIRKVLKADNRSRFKRDKRDLFTKSKEFGLLSDKLLTSLTDLLAYHGVNVSVYDFKNSLVYNTKAVNVSNKKHAIFKIANKHIYPINMAKGKVTSRGYLCDPDKVMSIYDRKKYIDNPDTPVVKKRDIPCLTKFSSNIVKQYNEDCAMLGQTITSYNKYKGKMISYTYKHEDKLIRVKTIDPEFELIKSRLLKYQPIWQGDKPPANKVKDYPIHNIEDYLDWLNIKSTFNPQLRDKFMEYKCNAFCGSFIPGYEPKDELKSLDRNKSRGYMLLRGHNNPLFFYRFDMFCTEEPVGDYNGHGLYFCEMLPPFGKFEYIPFCIIDILRDAVVKRISVIKPRYIFKWPDMGVLIDSITDEELQSMIKVEGTSSQFGKKDTYTRMDILKYLGCMIGGNTQKKHQAKSKAFVCDKDEAKYHSHKGWQVTQPFLNKQKRHVVSKTYKLRLFESAYPIALTILQREKQQLYSLCLHMLRVQTEPLNNAIFQRLFDSSFNHSCRPLAFKTDCIVFEGDVTNESILATVNPAMPGFLKYEQVAQLPKHHVNQPNNDDLTYRDPRHLCLTNGIFITSLAGHGKSHLLNMTYEKALLKVKKYRPKVWANESIDNVMNECIVQDLFDKYNVDSFDDFVKLDSVFVERYYDSKYTIKQHNRLMHRSDTRDYGDYRKKYIKYHKDIKIVELPFHDKYDKEYRDIVNKRKNMEKETFGWEYKNKKSYIKTYRVNEAFNKCELFYDSYMEDVNKAEEYMSNVQKIYTEYKETFMYITERMNGCKNNKRRKNYMYKHPSDVGLTNKDGEPIFFGDIGLRCCYTNAAASLIGGKTLHSMMGIIKGENVDQVFMKKLSNEKYMIIDEVSQIKEDLWNYIYLFAMKNNLTLILSGDPSQILSVEESKFNTVIKSFCSKVYELAEYKRGSKYDMKLYTKILNGEDIRSLLEEDPWFRLMKENSSFINEPLAKRAICYKNETRKEFNKFIMKALAKDNKSDFICFDSYDGPNAHFRKYSQHCILWPDTPVISLFNNLSRGIIKNKEAKVIKTNPLTINYNGIDDEHNIELSNFDGWVVNWAITGHKAQGQTYRFRYVILDIDFIKECQGERAKNYFYTCVSRSTYAEYIHWG